MQHHFEVELAIEYGIVEAILINHFEYWIELNRANEKNFYDGRYWTFNSIKGMREIFPYLSEKKIRNALKNLQDKGIIITGNYNRFAYDRTLWYAFSDLAESKLPKGQMEIAKRANGNCQKGEPIPDNNTPNNLYNNNKYKRFIPPTIDEVRAYCLERNNSIDAEYFVDYYQSRGWKYGQGKPILDWKACVRTWEKPKKEGNNVRTSNNTKPKKRFNVHNDLEG